MDIQTYLKDYLKQSDEFLEKFFADKKKETAAISPIVLDITKRLENFTKGGKRVRGGLIKLGYECCGGKDQKAVLEVSIAIELFQSFFLIHDDIIDRADFRRNFPTIHRQYEKQHHQKRLLGDRNHYGLSMAMILGDIASFWGYEILSKSKFPPAVANRAINHMIEVLTKTGYGEILDVFSGFTGKFSKNEVLKIHELKAAWYTIIGPLQQGAILAGADQKKLDAIATYGLPLGIAYQLQDDILGIYGDKKTLGKALCSDVQEGKNTLLITEALKRANPTQRKFLEKVWGNPKATKKDLNKIRKIFEETGSLAYSQKMLDKLIIEAKQQIEKITPDQKQQALLADLTDFVIHRKK